MYESAELQEFGEGDLRDVALVRTGVSACLRAHLKSTGQPVVLRLFTTDSCEWLSQLKYAMVRLSRRHAEQILWPIGVYRSRSLTGLLWDWMPEGSLHTLLYETQLYPDLPVAIRLQILYEVAEGLKLLHAVSLAHGSLKIPNILLDSDYHVKLSDWGQQSDVRTRVSSRSVPCFQDLAYQAPEVLQGTVSSVKSDMFSFGVLIWELLNRKPACEDISYLQNLVFAQHVVEPELDTKLLPPETPQCSALTQLMIRCWSAVPKQRPLAEECVMELRKALGMLGLDACSAAVHQLKTYKKRALLNCKYIPSWTLPIELSNLEGGSTDPKNLTSKSIPVRVPCLNRTAPLFSKPETAPKNCPLIQIRQRTFSGCCRNTINSSNGSSCHIYNNLSFRNCVWSVNETSVPPPPNTPCVSPTSLTQIHLQPPAVCRNSSGRSCSQLLQERREAIVKFMTEGRLNNLLDVLRSRQVVSREAYEIITAPVTLSDRTRCLLDTCACLGEKVSAFVALTLGLVSTAQIASKGQEG